MGTANGEASSSDAIEIEIDTKTLWGDVRDALLTELKHIPKPWQQMNEDEQQRLINRCGDISGKLVDATVDVIAARDLESLAIRVGKFQVDGAEIRGTFEAIADDENLLAIRHLAGKRALFVLADPSAYYDEKKTPVPDVVGTLKIPAGQPDLAVVRDALAAQANSLDVRQVADGALNRT